MTAPLTVKRNNYIKNPKKQDIDTPPEVAQFIADLFPDIKSVLDPCVGNGNLIQPFIERGAKVRGCDIKDGYDFLTMGYPNEEKYDLIVCNPPVGKK